MHLTAVGLGFNRSLIRMGQALRNTQHAQATMVRISPDEFKHEVHLSSWIVREQLLIE